MLQGSNHLNHLVFCRSPTLWNDCWSHNEKFQENHRNTQGKWTVSLVLLWVCLTGPPPWLCWYNEVRDSGSHWTSLRMEDRGQSNLCSWCQFLFSFCFEDTQLIFFYTSLLRSKLTLVKRQGAKKQNACLWARRMFSVSGALSAVCAVGLRWEGPSRTLHTLFPLQVVEIALFTHWNEHRWNALL